VGFANLGGFILPVCGQDQLILREKARDKWGPLRWNSLPCANAGGLIEEILCAPSGATWSMFGCRGSRAPSVPSYTGHTPGNATSTDKILTK
jgi:hypothetical protein